jgi:hypothetical protein
MYGYFREPSEQSAVCVVHRRGQSHTKLVTLARRPARALLDLKHCWLLPSCCAVNFKACDVWECGSGTGHQHQKQYTMAEVLHPYVFV